MANSTAWIEVRGLESLQACKDEARKYITSYKPEPKDSRYECFGQV